LFEIKIVTQGVSLWYSIYIWITTPINYNTNKLQHISPLILFMLPQLPYHGGSSQFKISISISGQKAHQRHWSSEFPSLALSLTCLTSA
jgi:hypothetical protein